MRRNTFAFALHVAIEYKNMPLKTFSQGKLETRLAAHSFLRCIIYADFSAEAAIVNAWRNYCR